MRPLTQLTLAALLGCLVSAPVFAQRPTQAATDSVRQGITKPPRATKVRGSVVLPIRPAALATPAIPSSGATPATPGAGGTPAVPATPARPAVPARPPTPPAPPSRPDSPGHSGSHRP